MKTITQSSVVWRRGRYLKMGNREAFWNTLACRPAAPRFCSAGSSCVCGGWGLARDAASEGSLPFVFVFPFPLLNLQPRTSLAVAGTRGPRLPCSPWVPLIGNSLWAKNGVSTLWIWCCVSFPPPLCSHCFRLEVRGEKGPRMGVCFS